MLGRTAIVVGMVAWVLAFSVSEAALHAQRNERTVFDSVYDAVQAKRGEAQYQSACVGCHGAELGGDSGPALKGEAFIRNWEAESVFRLFDKIKESMPLTGPETVTDETKLDVVAYILQMNGFPAGPGPLTLNVKALDSIKIVRRGATEAPNFTLVQTVGCLSQSGEGARWMLTNSTAPAATKEETPGAGALEQLEGVPLGAETFLLLSVTPFKPDAHRGHRMEARGLLNRAAGVNWLDLLSLQMVSSACRQ